MRTVIKKAQMLEVQEEHPKRITLTGQPANRSAFKIVRAEDTSIQNIPAKSITPVQLVVFPKGYSSEAIVALRNSMELDDEEVFRTEMIDKDGEQFNTVIRSGVAYEDAVKYTKFEMQDGVQVYSVIDSKVMQRSDKSITNIALSGMVFDSGKSVDEVEIWLSERSINYDIEKSYSDNEGHHVVIRSEIPEGAEIKSVKIEDGITALIHRAENMDMPAAVSTSVNEASYGSWGWGILDFNQYIANDSFREGFYEAQEALDEVIRNIMLHSELPIDERTTLMQNAIDAYRAFLTGLLQQLPKGAVLQRSEDVKMLGKNKDIEKVDGSTENVTERNEETVNAEIQNPVTMEEVKVAIQEAVTSATTSMMANIKGLLDGQVETLAARSEKATTDRLVPVLNSIEEIKRSVDEVNGSVVVRSDSQPLNSGKNVTKAPVVDVFSGVFGSPVRRKAN